MKEQSPAPVKVTAPCGCWSPTPLHINGALAVLAGRCLQGGEGLPPPFLRCCFPSSAPPACTRPSACSQVHQKKQPGLHGDGETAEKWQLNAAAPHLISTLALTEQIMGNNTPLCCGEMKCFSRRLSCCRDLFVTVPAEISLSFCLSLLSFPLLFLSLLFLFLSISALIPSSFTSCCFFLSLRPCFSLSPTSALFHPLSCSPSLSCDLFLILEPCCVRSPRAL